MKAYCLNNISKVALNNLKKPDEIVEKIENADSILVRSADMHEMNLDKNILAVARAGAGVNNIPIDRFSEEGIVVFNTPGANANAVKEIVLCSLILASRDLFGGREWVLSNKNDNEIVKSVENAKAKFAGNEIMGKKIAVLGLGKIGILVSNACEALGMKVIGYDPFLEVSNALKLEQNIKYVEKLEDALKDADYVTIHIPVNENTKYMMNEKTLGVMKKGAVLLNFSRDTLVDEDALKKAIDSKRIRMYITDFANPNIVKYDNTIIFPHLGASTIEAEDNCAMMAIDELKDYLENGNITNSVNYPSTNAGAINGFKRICINHHNVPGMIAKFSTILSNKGANITNLVNKSKGDYAYTIIDVEQDVDIKDILNVEGVLRAREI